MARQISELSCTISDEIGLQCTPLISLLIFFTQRRNEDCLHCGMRNVSHAFGYW